MTQKQSPWLEGTYGWDFGEGGWNSGMDQNLLKFSFMFDRNVDSIVSSLPAAVNGQAHYLTTDNRLYFAVGTTYFSTPVPRWFNVVVRATGATWQYNGTSLVAVESTASLDTRLDAVELTISSLGTAAFEDVNAFATTPELDIVEANAQAYTDALQQSLADATDPAKGAGQVGFTQSGAATPSTVQDKLTEIVSRADSGSARKELIKFKAGGASSDTVVINSSINDVKDNLSSATISGGGAVSDENYIGFGKNRVTFTSTGTAFTWPHLPTGSDFANLRLFKLSAFNFISTLTSPSDYTSAINGGQVDITLSVALASGERLIVEDKAAKVEDIGADTSYSWIGGGYDNIILNGVMQHVTGAHHRVLGGDHGSIFGGSYGIIGGGSYGFIGGGTNNEISAAGGVASVVVGGYRNFAGGGTSTIIGGQENKVTGAQAVAIGGTRNSVTATASVVAGRNNTVGGSDSFVVGDGNSSTGNYSTVFGFKNTVSNEHSHAKGHKAETSWSGQDLRFGYRDGNASWPQRQHFFLDLAQFTSTTASSKLQLLDGSTAILPRASATWKCRLQVSARGGNLKGATFTADFSIQRDASVTTLIGSVDITSKVDAGMGTSTNAASISIAIASNAIEITVQPRLDTAVSTKWHGVLEVVEVA